MFFSKRQLGIGVYSRWEEGLDTFLEEKNNGI